MAGNARFSTTMRDTAEPIWAAQRHHSFVLDMANGSLPPKRFAAFLKQDCLFIPGYAQALVLAAGRAPWLDVSVRLMEWAASLLASELELNQQLAQSFGVSIEELAAERPRLVTRAYTDFLVRVATTGDFAEVMAAFLPCFWGYYDTFAPLAQQAPSPVTAYARWINAYGGPELGAKVDWLRDVTDRAADEAGPETRTRMLDAFMASSEFEIAFWDAGEPGPDGGSAGTTDPTVPVRRFLEEALNIPHLDLLDELFAPDFVWHGSGGSGDVHGVSAFKALFPPFLEAFPDLVTRIDELLVSNNKVTARFTCTATHRGSFMNIPATERQVSWIGINVYEVADGRILEEWSCEDTWSILSGIGALLP